MKDNVYIYAGIIGLVASSFFLGWLFPVEGPIDYVYDNYASKPAIHKPSKCCAAPAPKKTEIYEDLNEDGEPEWYEVIPLFKVTEEEEDYER